MFFVVELLLFKLFILMLGILEFLFIFLFLLKFIFEIYISDELEIIIIFELECEKKFW